MSSEVQICNLALAHIGDSATVASINPPEGSAQAEHCARFYPIARDTLLEDPKASWKFATKRKTLAQISDDTTTKWLYAYALPSDRLRIVALTHPDAVDDEIDDGSMRSGEQFEMEALATDQVVIRCNVELAEVKYIYRVVDPAKFSNLFSLALSWRLAGMLAGPVIKGDAGRKAAQFCEGMALQWLGKASTADAAQSHDEKGPSSIGYVPYHLQNR